MIDKNILVNSYSRKVTYSEVTWTCLWCGQTTSEKRFPGSFIPMLCNKCRPIFRSWQRSNYYRRNQGNTLLSLQDWIQERQKIGKHVPEIKGQIQCLLDDDNQEYYHAPGNKSVSCVPTISNRRKTKNSKSL